MGTCIIRFPFGEKNLHLCRRPRTLETDITVAMRRSNFVTEKLVKKYYSEQGTKEWRRLAKDPYHKLEFDTTMHFIRKYLSKKKGLVLDAGGGPGKYTIEFGKLGFDVTLLDLSLRCWKSQEATSSDRESRRE